MGPRPAGGASGAKGRDKRTKREREIDNELENGTFEDFGSFAADDYLASVYKANRNALNGVQEEAIIQYKGDSTLFNGLLRGTSNRDDYFSEDIVAAEERIKALRDSMFESKENIIARRGFNDFRSADGSKFIERFENGTLIGSTFSDKGFTSVSVGPAAAFSQLNVQMTVRIPKGTRMQVPNPKGEHGDERELIIHDNASYRVTSAKVEDGYLKLEVDYVGESR